MKTFRNFRITKSACYIGYVTQAVTINFFPLLFLTFEDSFSVSLTQISLLIGINFAVQLAIDGLSAWFLDRVNLRTAAVLAHVIAAAGLIGLSFLPFVLPNAFAGLVSAVLLCGMGGGLTEVLISPVMEACPFENKTSTMSLLHSFYCWGQAGVVLLSIGFFALCGIANWRILACLFALIPIAGAMLFSFAPLNRFGESSEEPVGKGLLKNPLFPLLAIIICCAGASEMVMSQWVSHFAESALGVPKALGDLLGPCLFALLMGTSRLLYARCTSRLRPMVAMILSSLLCIFSYLIAALSPFWILSLVGCALCGFSVGILWPCTYSIAAGSIPEGGMRMFAILALTGDIGCLLGPTVAGRIADACGGNLRIPFLFATVFPFLLICSALLFCRICRKKHPDRLPVSR